MAQGLAHASNKRNLCEEVQRVCSGTLYRLVLELSRKAVQADILIAIRRFKNVVRWKNFWNDQKQSTESEVNEVIEEESRFMATGLNTNLEPTFGVKTAKHGSDNLEDFLTVVGKTLLKEAFKCQRFELPDRNNVLQELKNPDVSTSRQTKLSPQE